MRRKPSDRLRRGLSSWHQNVAESIEQDADVLTVLAQWRLNAYTSAASTCLQASKSAPIEHRGQLLAPLVAPESFVKVLRHVNHCDVATGLRRRIFAILHQKGWGIGCTPRIKMVRCGLRVLLRATSGVRIYRVVWMWRTQVQAASISELERMSEMAEAIMCEASLDACHKERADTLQQQLDEHVSSMARYDRGLEIATEVASSNLKMSLAKTTVHHTMARQRDRHLIRALICWRDKCDAQKTDLQPELDRWMDHFMLLKREHTDLEVRAAEAAAVQVAATRSIWLWKHTAAQEKLKGLCRGTSDTMNALMLKNSIELYRVSALSRVLRQWCCNRHNNDAAATFLCKLRRSWQDTPSERGALTAPVPVDLSSAIVHAAGCILETAEWVLHSPEEALKKMQQRVSHDYQHLVGRFMPLYHCQPATLPARSPPRARSPVLVHEVVHSPPLVYSPSCRVGPFGYISAIDQPVSAYTGKVALTTKVDEKLTSRRLDALAQSIKSIKLPSPAMHHPASPPKLSTQVKSASITNKAHSSTSLRPCVQYLNQINPAQHQNPPQQKDDHKPLQSCQHQVVLPSREAPDQLDNVRLRGASDCQKPNRPCKPCDLLALSLRQDRWQLALSVALWAQAASAARRFQRSVTKYHQKTLDHIKVDALRQLGWAAARMKQALVSNTLLRWRLRMRSDNGSTAGGVNGADASGGPAAVNEMQWLAIMVLLSVVDWEIGAKAASWTRWKVQKDMNRVNRILVQLDLAHTQALLIFKKAIGDRVFQKPEVQSAEKELRLVESALHSSQQRFKLLESRALWAEESLQRMPSWCVMKEILQPWQRLLPSLGPTNKAYRSCTYPVN